MKDEHLVQKSMSQFFKFLMLGSFIIGLMMYFGKLMGRDLYIFAQIYMLAPGAAVILTHKITGEQMQSLKAFNKTYLIGTFTILVVALAYIVTGVKELTGLISLIMLIVTIVVFFVVLKNKEDGVTGNPIFGIRKNLKSALIGVLIFILLYFTYTVVSRWLGLTLGIGKIEDFPKLKSNAFGLIFVIVPLFVFNFLPFIGEELGWRYYLQPVLQNKYGHVIGIILVGAIWGIWHLPLSFMIYSTQTPLLSLTNQVILCICYSIYFGYLYNKTENIWVVTFIHYLNNSFVMLYEVEKISDINVNPNAVALNALILVILYGPFVLAKKNITSRL